MEASKISIIIPTYNQSGLLMETLQSIVTQTSPPLEVLVVDDGSTDDTQVIAGSFVAKGVRYLSQHQKGSASARNRGLGEAAGNFIFSLDHDDLLAPTCLEEVQRAFTLFPEAGAVWMNFSVFGKDPVDDFLTNTPNKHDPFGFAQALKHAGGVEKDGITFLDAESASRLLCHAGPQSNSAIVYRKACLAGWDPNLCLGDDWGALYKALARGAFPVAAVHRVCWHKRVAEHNTSKRGGMKLVNRSRSEMEQALHDYSANLPAYAMSRLKTHLAENYLTTGYAASVSGNPSEAIGWYTRSFRLRPQWRPLWWGVRALARAVLRPQRTSVTGTGN